MSRGTRKLAILAGVLGTLVVVYIAGLLFNRPGSQPNVVSSFTVSAVTEVNAGGMDLRKRANETWQVSIDGSWYPADAGRITRMLSNLSGLRAARIASEGQADWNSFGVNASAASLLSVSGPGGAIATLFVGKTGSDGGTYVRTPRGSAVYEVFGNLPDYVASDASYWSNLRILPAQLSVDSLQTISISGHGFSVGGVTVNESYLLSSSVVNGKSAWVALDGRPLDQKKVLSLEAEIVRLEGDSFAAQVSPESAGMVNPSAVIEVSDQQGAHWKVIVGKRSGAQFYVKRSDEPYVYLVNQWSLHRALPKLNSLESSAKLPSS